MVGLESSQGFRARIPRYARLSREKADCQKKSRQWQREDLAVEVQNRCLVWQDGEVMSHGVDVIEPTANTSKRGAEESSLAGGDKLAPEGVAPRG